MPTIAASPLKVMTDHLLVIRKLWARVCGAEQYGLKSPGVSSGKLLLCPPAPLGTLPLDHDGQRPGELTWCQKRRRALMCARNIRVNHGWVIWPNLSLTRDLEEMIRVPGGAWIRSRRDFRTTQTRGDQRSISNGDARDRAAPEAAEWSRRPPAGAAGDVVDARRTPDFLHTCVGLIYSNCTLEIKSVIYALPWIGR
jgi:hypothetical protein